MANKFRDIDAEELKKLAWEYQKVCIASTREMATARGPVTIKERHLPTINYFLLIWLRMNHFKFYSRGYWYDALKNPEHPLSDTIKRIDQEFNALATDIVANEGKGIFYAKNKLGMTDRMQEDGTKTIKIIRGDRSGNQIEDSSPEPAEDI